MEAWVKYAKYLTLTGLLIAGPISLSLLIPLFLMVSFEGAVLMFFFGSNILAYLVFFVYGIESFYLFYLIPVYFAFKVRRNITMSTFSFICFSIVVTILSLLNGPFHSYSLDKFFRLIILLPTASILLQNIVRLNSLKFAVLSWSLLILYLRAVFEYELLGIDFEKFYFLSFIRDYNRLEYLFSYHIIGLVAALAGFSVYTLAVKFKTYILLISLLIVLMSGARQAMLLWLLLFATQWIRPRYVLLIVVTTFVVVYSAFGEVLVKSGGRSEFLNEFFVQISLKPLTGMGLGGFSTSGLRHYPHNLVLEVLVEFGFIMGGLILVSTLISFLFTVNRTREVTISWILLFVSLVRSMFSSDLTENFIFFVLIFTYNEGSFYSSKKA